MFYYIDGKVTVLKQNMAVLDVNGVGYALHISLNTLSDLKMGERAKLFTYLQVREDVFELYGFSTQSELDCFNLLLEVSGVGPKAALSVLSGVSPSQLTLSIATGDEKALTRVSGIGKKTAQRIILELKDKIAKQSNDMDVVMPTNNVTVSTGAYEDAVSGLLKLGCTQSEISSMLKGVSLEGMTAEEIIRTALTKKA